MRINVTCKNQKSSHSKINLISSYLHKSIVVLGGKDSGMQDRVRRVIGRVTHGAS
jgi:hypothetical protein